MAIKHSGQPRAAKTRRDKPIRFAVELTSDQVRIAILSIRFSAFNRSPMDVETVQLAHETVDYLEGKLSVFERLEQPTALVKVPVSVKPISFHPEKSKRRAPACARCASVEVLTEGDVCAACISPEAA